MAAPDGVLVVDKPAGWTSNDVVARCRRLAATRKVGHAGTLDPMATGVLVLGIGRATRLLGHLGATTKAYDATIRLGQSTLTDDADGEVVETVDASAVRDAAIEQALASLRGDLMQVPSSVSAIKVAGRRAYARVRAGEDVALPARSVHVHEFSLRAVRREAGAVDLDAHVECSTGTYVRALARDLGSALGVGGHLTALRRTRVGEFGADRAHELERLVAVAADGAEALPIVEIGDVAEATFESLTLASDDVPAVRSGRPLQLDLGETSPVALFAPDGTFLALYEPHGPVAKAVAVFAPA
jgi:tRNA pseudouridine55 synthase